MRPGMAVHRPDPVAVLEENNRARLPDLVPVRYGRMLTSPFAFLRGLAVDRAVPRSQGDLRTREIHLHAGGGARKG